MIDSYEWDRLCRLFKLPHLCHPHTHSLHGPGFMIMREHFALFRNGYLTVGLTPQPLSLSQAAYSSYWLSCHSWSTGLTPMQTEHTLTYQHIVHICTAVPLNSHDLVLSHILSSCRNTYTDAKMYIVRKRMVVLAYSVLGVMADSPPMILFPGVDG